MVHKLILGLYLTMLSVTPEYNVERLYDNEMGVEGSGRALFLHLLDGLRKLTTLEIKITERQYEPLVPSNVF